MPKLLLPSLSLVFALVIPAVAHAETWTHLSSSPPKCYELAAFGDNNVLCIQRNVPSPGLVSTSVSTDGGETWSTPAQPPPGPPPNGALHWRDATVGFIGSIGQDGKNALVWKTADAGKSFQLKTLPVEHDTLGVIGIHFTGAIGHAIAAYSVGGLTKSIVARSTNDGETWTESPFPKANDTTKEIPAAVATVDATTVIVLTDEGIWRSTDSGVTFTKVQPKLIGGNGRYFVQMFGQVGYAGGGSLLKTVDGGATWKYTKTPEVARNHIIQAIRFADANTGLIAHSNSGVSNVEGRMWRTVDGTDNWIEEARPAEWLYVPSSIAFPSPGRAYSSGFGPRSAETTPSVVRAGAGGGSPIPGSSGGASSSGTPTPNGTSSASSGAAPAAASSGGDEGCNTTPSSRANTGTLLVAGLAVAAALRRRGARRSTLS